MSHVLLLRSPSDAKGDTDAGTGAGAGTDPYEAQLAPATSVPVYETVQTLEELQWILETGPDFHGYKGVIVTSKRAVDAWEAATRKVPPVVDDRAHWTDIPFYAVGAATASAVRDLSQTISSALAPRQVLGGDEAGTGEQLAHFILAHLAAQRDSVSTRSGTSVSGSVSSNSLTLSGSGSVSTDNLSLFVRVDGRGQALAQGQGEGEDKGQANGEGEGESLKSPTSPKLRRSRTLRRPTKLLFLVGDKTRDALPKILSSDETVELDSVQVYATKPSPDFPTALRNAVLGQPKVKDWWIAFFAPSSADYAVPYLREHFTLPITFSSTPSLTPSSANTPTSTSNLTAPIPKKKSKKEKNGKGGGALPAARIAAIGPTTATHVRDVLRLEVAAVAAKPNAEALTAAIKAAK